MPDWNNQQVLVTGAGGFIASHLVETLVREGARVRAFVRYNSRGDPGLLNLLDPDVLASVEIVAGDLRDPDAVQSTVRGMSTVFHLGALIAIPYSYLHPVEVVETNVMGTLNALMAARAHGVEFLERDFRPRFREGQRRARELELYMQKYCGCVFSEEERYHPKPDELG